MKTKEVIEIPTVELPDHNEYLNITAWVQNNNLIINFYYIDDLKVQIELDNKISFRAFPSHYHYSSIVDKRDYIEPWLIHYYSDYKPARFLDGADKVIESFTNIPLKYGIDAFFKLLNKKYSVSDRAYKTALKEEEDRERIFSTLPDEPADILEYATTSVLKSSAYLVSSPNILRKTYRDFYCTSCYNTFTAKPKLRGLIEKCPHCNTMSEVRYRKVKQDDRSEFAVYQLSADGKGVFVRYYLCRRNYRENYRNVKTEICELGRYYFAPGIAKQWTRTEHCQSTQNQYFTDSDTWYKRGMFFFACSNIYGGYIAAKEVILKVFPHCQLDAYRERIIRYGINLENICCYISKYAKSPQLEYFLKLKLDTFVQEYVYKKGTKINWRGKSIESIFGLPKEIIKAYVFTNKIKDSDALVVARALIKQGQFSNENMVLIDKIRNNIGKYSWNLFRDQFIGQDIVRVSKYLFTQQAKEERYTKRSKSVYDIYIEYKDYLEMAKKVNYNLESDYFRYPKYLKKAHDDVQKLIKIQANQIIEQGVKKQAKKLSKLTFKYNGLIIRPASSSKEIEYEGKIQDICIANYIERYSKGETSLFFIRKCSEIKTPFYAVEIFNGVVRQVRGKKNCPPTPEIEAFMEAFKAEKLDKKKPTKIKTENRIKVAV